MKRLICWMLVLIAGAALPGWHPTAAGQSYSYSLGGGGFSQGTTTRLVLTIKADGSCTFASQANESRMLAEQQARMMERWQHDQADDEDEDEDNNAPESELSATNATAGPKPYTDAELTQKITEMMNQQNEDSGTETGQKFAVEVKKDLVSITTTHTFASVEDMLKNGYSWWFQSGIVIDNVRFETDTNGQLRVTLTPRKNMDRYLKNIRSQWKLAETKLEFMLIFPGPVLASGLPGTQTNATWLIVDNKQDETLDQLVKLHAAPTVITAEAGGLKLSQPLDSKKLRRSGGSVDALTDGLPLTDAGPGFVAEAQSLVTTTLHIFPDGKDYFKNIRPSFGNQTGTVVNVKLFAPPGRILKSVSNPRALTAVDDQGRSLVTEDTAEESGSTTTYSGNSDHDGNAMQIQIHLPLPAPDAQSLDKVSAEAEAFTIGAWKEMTLTNLQENATNQLDLAAVLPGAKLTITKLSFKNSQLKIQARLHGPRALRGLEIQAKIPGNSRFTSNSYNQNSTSKGGEFTRTLTVQGYSFGNDEALSTSTVVLLIRQPLDQRRERVQFELKGLDLL